jgi:hypothetical protein
MQIVHYAIDNNLADKVLSLLAGMLSRQQQLVLLRRSKYADAKAASLARQLVGAAKDASRG